MIKAVIFDCDGTVYDNCGAGDLGDVLGLKRAYDELGINAELPSKETLMKKMGSPYPVFFKGIIPDESFEDANPLAMKYAVEEAVKLVRAGKGKLYPGAIETMAALRKAGIRMGMATNGNKPYIKAVVETYKLDRLLDIYMSYQEVKGDKGDVVSEELRRLKVRPENALMVGDRKSDMEAARKAGCKATGATYGYGSKEELKDADFMISRITQLPSLVEKC